MNDNNTTKNDDVVVIVDGDSQSASLSKKLQTSLSTISCCFRRGGDPPAEPALVRSSSLWARPRRHEALPEIKDRCRALISRLAGAGRGRRHSADFRYDPLSYSMNFDHGLDGDDDSSSSSAAAGFPFSSRFPPSPDADGSPSLPRKTEIVSGDGCG